MLRLSLSGINHSRRPQAHSPTLEKYLSLSLLRSLAHSLVVVVGQAQQFTLVAGTNGVYDGLGGAIEVAATKSFKKADHNDEQARGIT